MKNLLISLMMFALVISCSAPWVYVTELNRENLIRLSVGMTKDQAMAVMGTQTRHRIANPYQTEGFKTADGKPVEILLYLTGTAVKPESGWAKESFTPLLIEDGRLIGWGWTTLDAYKYEIHIR